MPFDEIINEGREVVVSDLRHRVGLSDTEPLAIATLVHLDDGLVMRFRTLEHFKNKAIKNSPGLLSSILELSSTKFG